MDPLLIIGSAGSVGHDMIYQIAAMNAPIKVIGADVNEEKGIYEIEEALHSAHNLGNFPDIEFQKMNLFDIDTTADQLKEMKPKVICNLGSLGSWWVTRLLPDDVYEKIGPVGPWIPNHFTLASKLMQAVKKSKIKTNVVNGAFPDLTNGILSKLGLAPTCGGGNMDLGISRIRRLVSRDLNVPFRNVIVYGVGHHGSYYTARMNGPMWYKISANGEEVTEKYPHKKIVQMYQGFGYGKSVQYQSSLVDQFRTSSSFLKHCLAIYNNTGEVCSAVAGPNGLPGAYPCKLSEKGAEVVLPGISLEDAIKINEDGALIDGIDHVEADGTVVFVKENVEYMREVVGYYCEMLKPSEQESRQKELEAGLKRLYEKYKVKA
jgi:malate/lactate dehydrogenase